MDQQKVTLTNKSENWDLTVKVEDIFTSDDLINAYFKGKNEGAKAQDAILLDALKNNINLIGDYTLKMMSFLYQNNFSPSLANLRINSINDFSVLITVSEDDFLSEDFLKSYEYASELENQETDRIKLNFIFTDADENFDKSLLASDGFYYSLKKDVSLD